MSSLHDFIKKHGIQMTVEKRDSRPDGLMSDTKMDHWQVCLTAKDPSGDGRTSMNILYSMGIGHNGVEPEINQVLESLHSDSSGHHGSFEEWASEYGYDEGSRKAEKIYQAVKAQARQLEVLLGTKGFDEFKNLDPNTF